MIKWSLILSLIIFSQPLWSAQLKPLYNYESPECPAEDALNHYIRVPLFYDLKSVARVENIPNLKFHDELRARFAGRSISLYYEIHRHFDPQKETLFLIPGGPGEDHRILHRIDKLLEEKTGLLDHFNLVAMDHRGLGCSRPRFPGEEPSQSLLMRYAASDIETIRRNLVGPEKKIHVLGFSYGTMLAQTYALLYPGSVERLYLGAAFSSYRDFPEAQRKFEYIATSSIPGLFDRYLKVKEKDAVLSNAFLNWAVSPMYSYSGRVKEIPEKIAELEKLLDQGNFESAYNAVKTETWVMPWMMRSIVCIEIFPWKKLADDEFQMFPVNFDTCREFEGQYEYFDYTENLRSLPMRTFIWGGAYDHVTTYEAMIKMAQRIPDNFFYLDPHLGHSTSGKGVCFAKMVEAFFNGKTDVQLREIAYSDACKRPPTVP
ncbi:MAG: alpha/beta fold hydrolase [Bdellovibrionota bacterium]